MSSLVSTKMITVTPSNVVDYHDVLARTPITALNIQGKEYGLSLDENAFAEAMKKYMSQHTPVYYKMECQSCGAPVDQRIDDHIMKCPYCHSVYAIGTMMTNARY